MFAAGYNKRADGSEAVRGYRYRHLRDDSRAVPLNTVSLYRIA